MMLRHASLLSNDGFILNVSSRVKFLDMGPGGAVTRISIRCDRMAEAFFKSIPRKERSSANVVSFEKTTT